MKSPTTPRRRRGPDVDWNGSVFRVTIRGRSIAVPASADEDDILVDLDALTHWEPAPGVAEGQEVTIEDLQEILEAIEAEAERLDLQIAFE